MKHCFYIFLLCIGLAGTALAQGKQSADDACTPIESRAKCKEALVPFEYDAGKIVRITFRSMSQQKEYEIPLYMGEKYRLVFNREGLPQNVSIKVYDKKQGSSNRKVLYSSDDASFDEKQLIWEPESTGKIFIHFDIPATSDVEKRVVFFSYWVIKDNGIVPFRAPAT